MRVLRVIIVIIAAILASAVFFRAPVLSGFDVMPCDKLDGSLIFGIVDHWRQVFSGERDWRSLQMFWPVANTIGYSDTFFIHGVIYSILCKFGVDQYYAFTATFMLIAACGFALMHILLRRYMRIPFALSLAVSFIFVNLSPIQTAGTHLQLTTVWLLPALMILGIEGSRIGRRSYLWAAGFAITLAAMFLTAFYVPWFFTFFLCVTALVWLVAKRAAGMKFGGIFAIVRDNLFARKNAIITFCVVFTIALLPFLDAYLPALNSGGAWSYKGMARSLPSLVDYVNVGSANQVWGGLFGSGLDGRDYAYELHFGLPIVTFAAFIFAAARFASRSKSQPESGNAALFAAFAVIVCWLVIFRCGGWSLWSLVHLAVPGAGAIRAVFRFNVVLSFFSLFVVSVMLKDVVDKGGRAGIALTCVLIAAIFAEQFSYSDESAFMRRSEDISLMQSVPHAPVGAHAFFVVSSKQSNVWAQITAFRIAQKFGLETVNGFSGSAPRGYLPKDIHSTDYWQNIRGWLDFDYESFRCLDLDTMKWGVADFGAYEVYPTGDDIVASGRFSLFNAGGWSQKEVSGVWSDGKFAKLVLFMAPDSVGKKSVELEFSAFIPKNTPYQRAAISVNGIKLGAEDIHKPDEIRHVRFQLPTECNDSRKLVFTFELPKARSPSSRGLGNDERLLGIQLKSFSVVTEKEQISQPR